MTFKAAGEILPLFKRLYFSVGGDFVPVFGKSHKCQELMFCNVGTIIWHGVDKLCQCKLQFTKFLAVEKVSQCDENAEQIAFAANILPLVPWYV